MAAHGHSSHGHGSHGARLGDGTLPTEDQDEGLGHIVPLEVYKRTFIALLFLTAITVLAANIDLGKTINVILAVTIATVKASLVAVVFMHLKFEGKVIWLYVLYPLIVLSLLIGGTLFDEADRFEITPRLGDIVK